LWEASNRRKKAAMEVELCLIFQYPMSLNI